MMVAEKLLAVTQVAGILLCNPKLTKFDLAVIQLTDCMIMIQGDGFIIVNSERCPVHVDFCFREQHFLSVSRCRSLCDLIDHPDRELPVLLRLEIPSGTSDTDRFSVSGMLHILAGGFQILRNRQVVFTAKNVLDQGFQFDIAIKDLLIPRCADAVKPITQGGFRRNAISDSECDFVEFLVFVKLVDILEIRLSEGSSPIMTRRI